MIGDLRGQFDKRDGGFFDGGVEPELRTFANHVASDQEIEIGRAQEMLAEIDEGSSNAP